MPALIPNRLAKQLQRKTVEHFYGDTGSLLQDTVTSLDEYGQPVVTTTPTTLACSFTDAPDMERWKDFADIEQIAAEVRFAGSTAPARGNRFTVTGRWGDSTFTDATFEIVGIKDRGAFGYVCALKKVQI
jgi:hypothetical protein